MKTMNGQVLTIFWSLAMDTLSSLELHMKLWLLAVPESMFNFDKNSDEPSFFSKATEVWDLTSYPPKKRVLYPKINYYWMYPALFLVEESHCS